MVEALMVFVPSHLSNGSKIHREYIYIYIYNPIDVCGTTLKKKKENIDTLLVEINYFEWLYPLVTP